MNSLRRFLATLGRWLPGRRVSKKPLTIDDLGWTKEKAIAVRGQFSAFAEDWDDPAMDVFDELYSDNDENEH